MSRTNRFMTGRDMSVRGEDGHMAWARRAESTGGGAVWFWGAAALHAAA